MIDINARGYVSNGKSKVAKSGREYSQFTLGVKQKDKGFNGNPETVTWANYSVTDFSNANPPADKSYVTLSGFLKVRNYTVEGTQRQSLDIVARELTVAPPFGDKAPGDKATAATSIASTKEPWDQ